MVKIKQLFCKHKYHDIKKIVIHDFLYDKEIDNDELDDFPTYLKVFYCKKCGKLLGVKNYKCTIVPFYIYDLSNRQETEEFEKITGYKVKNITKTKNKPNYDS